MPRNLNVDLPLDCPRVAVLLVKSWSTVCSLCGGDASLSAQSHEVLLGYGPENGSPGCGALFVAIAEYHAHYGDFAEGVKALRSDLPFVDLWTSVS